MSSNLSNSLFYNGPNREYNADSFEKLFRAFFNSGVSRNGGGMRVYAAGGMGVRVTPGLVNCDGKIGVFEGDTEITLSTAEASSARTDYVIAHRDDSQREIRIMVQTAPPASQADVVLAKITVPAGAAAITGDNIDMSEASGRREITQAVDTTDKEAYEEQFNTWLSGMETALSGSDDPSVALAGQIAELSSQISGINTAINGSGGLASQIQAAQQTAGSASTLRCRLVKPYLWQSSADIQNPACLVSESTLQSLSNSTDESVWAPDLLLVLFRRDYQQGSPVIPVFLRRGEAAKAFDYANGQFYTREVRWNTAEYTLAFKVEGKTKAGSKVAPTEVIPPGLMVSWAQQGPKEANSGNLFTGYTAGEDGNSTFNTAADAKKKNYDNDVKNTKYNVFLLPVAVYLFTGIPKTGNS